MKFKVKSPRCMDSDVRWSHQLLAHFTRRESCSEGHVEDLVPIAHTAVSYKFSVCYYKHSIIQWL